MSLSKVEKRNKIKKRIRQHVLGSESRPRLSVFRSNKEIYAQIVDDVNGKTLAAASSRDKDIARGFRRGAYGNESYFKSIEC